MDIERYLIILKGEDKTDKIRSYENTRDGKGTKSQMKENPRGQEKRKIRMCKEK